MASNVFGIVEQWRIRVHIREEEAASTLTAKPTKKPRSRPGWLDRLQKKVQEAQRIESARKKKNKA